MIERREFITLFGGAVAACSRSQGCRDRIPECLPPSVTAHATTDLSTPWPSFDAALIRGSTVISTS